MLRKIIYIVAVNLICTIAYADSISIVLKPEKGLTGTTSFNFHENGNVTLLVYESPTKITESTVNVSQKQIKELKSRILSSLQVYLNKNDFSGFKERNFTVSLNYTAQGVTKSVSSKKINSETMEVISYLLRLSPDLDLSYVK